MARAHSIYLLTDAYMQPFACFTVKHELVSYYEKYGSKHCRIFRTQDGPVTRTPVMQQISPTTWKPIT